MVGFFAFSWFRIHPWSLIFRLHEKDANSKNSVWANGLKHSTNWISSGTLGTLLPLKTSLLASYSVYYHFFNSTPTRDSWTKAGDVFLRSPPPSPAYSSAWRQLCLDHCNYFCCKICQTSTADGEPRADDNLCRKILFSPSGTICKKIRGIKSADRILVTSLKGQSQSQFEADLLRGEWGSHINMDVNAASCPAWWQFTSRQCVIWQFFPHGRLDI